MFSNGCDQREISKTLNLEGKLGMHFRRTATEPDGTKWQSMKVLIGYEWQEIACRVITVLDFA